MTTVVHPWSIVVAFGVAAGIGALSGSYPASGRAGWTRSPP